MWVYRERCVHILYAFWAYYTQYLCWFCTAKPLISRHYTMPNARQSKRCACVIVNTSCMRVKYLTAEISTRAPECKRKSETSSTQRPSELRNDWHPRKQHYPLPAGCRLCEYVIIVYSNHMEWVRTLHRTIVVGGSDWCFNNLLSGSYLFSPSLFPHNAF